MSYASEFAQRAGSDANMSIPSDLAPFCVGRQENGPSRMVDIEGVSFAIRVPGRVTFSDLSSATFNITYGRWVAYTPLSFR